MDNEKVIKIAQVCHEANKAWCELNDDFSQKSWNKASAWQKISAVNGVQFRLTNYNAGPEAMHNNWMAEKKADGWVYGLKKDEKKKTHHCMVDFGLLPLYQQKKDKMFSAIVDALK